MHRHDGAGLGCDGSLDEVLIYVQRVGADVHEHRHCAAQHEGIGGGDEGVGRQDDFVAGLQVAQNRGHLQCGGTGVREQGFAAAQFLFEPAIALLGVSPIPRQMPLRDGIGNQRELAADDERFIEGDRFHLDSIKI